MPDFPKLKVAIFDLNNNTPNQSMRCLKALLGQIDYRLKNYTLVYDIYDVRHKEEVPDNQYDIYLSSGGPGSPFEGEGTRWEARYFEAIDRIWNHNQQNHFDKKHLFFICHSFQMMTRFFDFASVTRRKSTSFGIFPIHRTAAGERELCFQGLPEPFYVADFRDWQVIEPHTQKMQQLGAEILCLEKERPHLDYPRAIMGIRISEQIIGTQFHPEADAYGMKIHFQSPERKKMILDTHGEAKYEQLIEGLDSPEKINLTYQTILPNFLENAIISLKGDDVLLEKTS